MTPVVRRQEVREVVWEDSDHSLEIDIQGFRHFVLEVPSDFVGTQITFEASKYGSGTLGGNVYDTAGNQITVTIPASGNPARFVQFGDALRGLGATSIRISSDEDEETTAYLHCSS